MRNAQAAARIPSEPYDIQGKRMPGSCTFHASYMPVYTRDNFLISSGGGPVINVCARNHPGDWGSFPDTGGHTIRIKRLSLALLLLPTMWICIRLFFNKEAVI